jgi:hypothetical protein
VDELFDAEKNILNQITSMSNWLLGTSTHRWLAIGKTDIEKGFMSLRKGVTLSYLEKKENNND